ncbi:DNA-dependent protein kinase catalytic subunit isoform X3 [Nematostella vectensis]|uniref:DNA-dependent protein kinase catalytic subunit isoform X3 n=1 Tax=Nematostella vectensis TaxID=45351 RepID=UPI00207796F7|nr:DNA-dependent protein kinase catalytic subunit isoform X3 [Nematostella vectensis]
MMTDAISSRLLQLNELVAEESPLRGQESAEIARDLRAHCSQLRDESELARCSSILFDDKTGIIRFLHKTIANQEFVECKTELLKFLQSYLGQLNTRVNPYAVAIKDICMKLLFQESSSKVKIETFLPLIQLMQTKLESSIIDEMDIPKLIDRYFKACLQSSKQQSTVRFWLYTILGVFAEVFPEHMLGNADRLISIYINLLNSEMKSKGNKSPDKQVIAGCLKGLSSYLVNFTQSAAEGSKFARDIYEFTRMAIDVQGTLQRYDVPRAGLNLLSRHAGQFQEYICTEHNIVYPAIYRWCCHQNRETKYAALDAMDSFLKQVSEYIVLDEAEAVNPKEVFKDFIQRFRAIIDSDSSTTQQMSIAIRGYGFFAKPCKLFMTAEDVKFMFTEMMQRSEQIYLRQSEMQEDRVQQLPNFLEALSFIIEELDDISDGFLVSLERLIIVLFESFPRLSKSAKYLCHKALVKMLINISAKGSVLKNFLSEVVYQGLIRTCSHPVLLDEGPDVDKQVGVVTGSRSDQVTFKDYLPLWEHMLDKTKFKSLSLSDIEKRESLHELVYDELVGAILRIIHKLDLTSTKHGQQDLQTSSGQLSSDQEEQEETTSDPVAGLQPRVQKDFLVFINLVDFCKALLPGQSTDSFGRWVYVFGRDLIVSSSRFPVVSGFYKLLEVCMKICKRLRFFQSIRAEYEVTADDMEIVDTSDCTNCFILFRKFIKEVLIKMKQFKEDLLSSCLSLVLSLPYEIVAVDVAAIVPALELTFKLGLSYLPLAQAGLAALEEWNASLPGDVLRPHLRNILPYLDGYLKSATDAVEEEQDQVSRRTATLRSTYSRLGKIVKPGEQPRKVGESSLVTIRVQILRLLGQLGGHTNLCLLGSDGGVDSGSAVAWDTVKHLPFAVPFQDMKPTIYLDPFLPRVVELATTSSNRQTKVAACELLHTLVLYMLGKGVTQPDVKKSPMQNLWKKLIPVLLQLACDVERVSAQLFHPLVMQLIHWFTNNRKYESPETIALLDALLEGVVHPTDTSLRDFSAQCIREFLQWSIKQTSAKQLEKSPINIKSLLKRLYSLALHPNASKRLGASLAFNSIYTVFREERSLVDVFVLEILVTYLESLALAHTDDPAQGTQDQCSQVISHLERIIKTKATLLDKENKQRRIPRGFQMLDSITLSHLIPLLIKLCGKPQTECRHQCMKLVCQVTPLLHGIGSAAIWMKNTHKEHDSFFVRRFEGGGGRGNGILTYPTLADMGGAFSLKETLLWFHYLLAALDCYTWVFGEQLLPPADLLSPREGSKYSSVLFTSLSYFLSNLAMLGIQAAIKCFPKTTHITDVATPKEMDEYNRVKCTVIVRIMNFFTVLLQAYPDQGFKIVPTSLWSDDLFTVVFSCALEPALIGFNVGDVEVIEKLPEQTSAVCIALTKLPEPHLANFKNCLARKLALGSRCNLFEKLPIPLAGEDSRVDHLYLSHLVTGYKQLHAAGLLMDVMLTRGSTKPLEYGSRLLNAVYEGACRAAVRTSGSIIVLSPASHQLACKLLELAFDLGIEHITLQRCIIQTTPDGSSVGAVFYTTFQASINTYLIKNAQSHIPQLVSMATSYSSHVCSILNSILDQFNRDKTSRKRYGSVVCASIVNSWEVFSSLWDMSSSSELKQALLEIMKKLLLSDPKCLIDPAKPAFQIVLKMFTSVFDDKNLTLTFKSRAVELFPYFKNLPDNYQSQLKSCIDTLVTDNFPLKSTEFIPGSPRYNDYIATLDKLLVTMVTSGSLVLLQVITAVLCREERHVHEEEIQKSLAAFIQRLAPSSSLVKGAVDVTYRIFTNERDHTSNVRLAVLDRVSVTLLCNASKAGVSEFFSSHVKEIMEIIEAKQLKTYDPGFESQLVSKMCAFRMIEVLYSRLGKAELNSPQSSINLAYCPNDNTGKELTKAITKSAHAAKSEDMRGETVAFELRRQLHCAAYNALLALISCTQTELKFYTAFLFNENPVKGQFLLDNLIDTDRKYEFEVELSTPLERKKQMTSIRINARVQSDQVEEALSQGRSVRYLSSQYLADSSLSEEVSQFDFSTPVQAFSATDITKVQASDNQYEGEDSYEIGEDVEMDELNSHECLTKICSLLTHMKESNISPQPDKGALPKDMPSWMSALHKKLTNFETHLNIQLFIAKVIINQSQVFEPYARFWLSPLMELILKLIEEEGENKRGLNYFVVDLLVTILSWATTAIPEDSYGDRHLASRLLQTVMRRTHHENRAVFKNNLEIVKTMVEVWRERITVPTKVIYEALSNPHPDKKDNATGIQLLGVVLANKIHPFSSDSSVDENTFYTALSDNLTFKYKDVHAPAAEVSGMLMKYLIEERKVTECSLIALVEAKLSPMATKGGKDIGKFITCVHRLQLNYPRIVDRFMKHIMFHLPTIHGVFKAQCLEIVLSRVSDIPDLFTELRSKGLNVMFEHRDEGVQVALLKIIQGLLEKLKMSEIEYVVPSIATMATSSSTACRELMYDIFMWVYDTYRSDETFRNEEGSEEILATAKDYLLRGLADDNKILKLKLQNFWSDETRLPNTTLERLVDVLRAMYSTNTEQQYLSYTTNLVLHLTSFSPDFERLMFEQPLSECKFEEYPIDYSWQQRHVVMTPLFAATQGSTQSHSQGGSLEPGALRATQFRVEFTPTMDQGLTQAFDWLNPSSQADSVQSFTVGSSEAQSSLLFGTKPRASQRSLKPVPHDFGSRRLAPTQSDSQQATPAMGSQQQEILRLKRRFTKDSQTKDRQYFIRMHEKKRQMLQQTQSRLKAARESQVVMYRRYRAGDLPDVQIKHSELIAPLQAVAQCDSTLAKQLFSVLVQAILSQMDEKLTEQDAEKTVTDIQGALDNIMTSSTQFYPPFISCIEDICYHKSMLKLQPSSVSTASLASLQQPMGILLLEKQLLSQEAEPKSHKRMRTEHSPSSDTTAAWLELAKLYRSVEEFDVLHGIFSDHIGTKPITRLALEAEARGDYAQALKIYNEAMSCDDWSSKPQQQEEDLWDDARMQCFANLAKWGDLEEYSKTGVDDEGNPPDLDKIWTDTYLQEHYLPFIMRSSIKLICEGEERPCFLEFLRHSMMNEERKAFLESRYGDDLALLFILRDDYGRARYHVTNCFQAFLKDWSGLSSMMVSSRASKLQSIQKITEMQEFLEFVVKEENFCGTGALEDLFSRWSVRFPNSKLHPISVWDDVITNRSVYMSKFFARFEMVNGGGSRPDSMDVDGEWSCPSVDALRERITREEVALQLKMVQAAREQSNFPVAHRYLRESLKSIKDVLHGDENLHVKWTHAYAVTQQKKAHGLMAIDAVQTALSTVSKLDSHTDSNTLANDPVIALRHHILRSRCFDILTDAIAGAESVVLSALGDSNMQRLGEACGCGGDVSQEKIVSQLITRSFTSLQEANKAAKQAATSSSDGSTTCMVEAMMAMVPFCDRALRRKEDDSDCAPEIDIQRFPEFVVRYVLKAMEHGSEEARNRFPRLLQIVELYPHTLDSFVKKVETVPCWMFIGWINQMVALMDKKEARAVHGIVTEIAKNYPQALCYAFKVSSEQFVFDSSPEGNTNRKAVERIRKLLESPLMDSFIAALEQLHNPEMAFKDWCDGEIKQLLQTKNKKAIKEAFRSIYKQLFDSSVNRATDSSQPAAEEMGPFRKKFSKEHASRFENIFGKDGEKLVNMSLKEFGPETAKLKQQMVSKPPGNLKEYSPWLTNFQADSHAQKLEVPGQYTGQSKPMPEYHVNIAGFDEKVLVLASIRKPKRVTIRGDDERDHMFLVKGGEDIRLDQRIEQLFCMMNEVMSEDPACSQRNLRLRTYQVIPMTQRVGLIEWLKNTKPLKELLHIAATESEKQAMASARNLHQKWVNNFVVMDKKKNVYLAATYGNIYREANRTDTESEFKKKQAQVPWDLLRRAFQQLAASPEAYLTLRTHFARTHACICICQYVLGIGDRHLSNFLVDMRTGGLIGIDFGHSFGSATQFLPVPELVPFRLTRQFTNLLLPLKESGLVRNTMIHVMRALRGNHELLLNTMDVFVKEPSLDWQMFARKQAEDQHMEIDEDLTWYPREKVLTAQRKLKGANPAFVTRQELELGHRRRSWFRNLQSACLGDRRHNVRAQKEENELTSEAQVDCLIDQATDVNILGRAWEGWEAWV